MNGMHAPVMWQEARNEDGRVYYYHVVTKATQWTKPEELMTPAERAVAIWKEYTAEGGRKYWHNTETGITTWDMPDVLKAALERETRAPQATSAPEFNPSAGYSNHDIPDREPTGPTRQIAYNNDVNGSRAQIFIPANKDPDYQTFEEAEAAFMKVLRKNNVEPDWSWEQTLRAIIRDPQFRALKDPKDRKAAFEKYAIEVRLEEKDKAKERLAKLRNDFATMLKSHPEIKHYTRWKTARAIIENETIFKSAKNDDERRQLFEDYIIELKKAHVEHEAVSRKAAMDELVQILQHMNLEPYTRWSEAQGIIQSHQKFQVDDKFKTLSKSDILVAFESHIKGLERTFNDARQTQKNQRARRERQNRDRYLALLKELKAAGKIMAGSKWSDVHKLVENDDRYVSMLGQSGSSPLDFFWEMVEDDERALRSTRNIVLDVLDDKRFEIQQKTDLEEFLVVMNSDRRTANIDRNTLSLIFERLHEKVSRRNEDDRHQAEKKQRRTVDDLRSFIKHLDQPAVRVNDTYEEVLPRFEKSAPYLALADDELRRSAFEKVIRRLKEKEEEEEKERAKRRQRASVDRSSHRDRERDRGDRSHRGSDRFDRPTRSPEPDAYEADRRRAIADREKNYRKGNVADTLLSPGRPRGLDRGDRERDRDRERERERDPRARLDSRDRDRRDSRDLREYDIDRPHHRSRRDDDRERRDPREEEREKMYRRRGDPRGTVDELPYGDDKPSTSRRRREETDAEAGKDRDAKRTKRDRSPVRESPAPSRKGKTPPVAVEEEAAVHSGSEEGEIEEE